MKSNLMTNLRASVFALSAASLAVTVPAIAEMGSDKQMSGSNPQKFSQLDQDGDQRLNQEEIQTFAEDKRMDAEQILSRFDRDNDDALDQQEFQQLGMMNQQESERNTAGIERDQQRQQQASAEQGNEPDGPQVVVDQQATQIEVDKPAAQVTVDQPKPKVTVTTQDPQVEVEQAEPRVSVQQNEPQVSVDQAEPNVEVQDAEPDVSVSRAEPQVDVNEQEPEVEFESADAERDAPEQNELASEDRNQRDLERSRQTNLGSDPQQESQLNRQANRDQQDSQRQSMAAQTEQQTQRGNQADQGGELYNRPISELRSAEVVDEQGETLGNVAEVVVKQDGSEAGFIISTTGEDNEQRHIYRAAEDFEFEGDQIVFTEDPQSLTEPQGFMAEDFMAAQGEENRTLDDLVNREGLSAR